MAVSSRLKGYGSGCWRQSFENKRAGGLDGDDGRRGVIRTGVSARGGGGSELVVCVSVVGEDAREFVRPDLPRLDGEDVISHKVVVIVVVATYGTLNVVVDATPTMLSQRLEIPGMSLKPE